MYFASSSVALRMKDRSGSPVLRSGVGTQMLTASASCRSGKIGGRLELAGRYQAGDLLSWYILDVAFAALNSIYFALVGVDADHCKASFGKNNCQRQADIA